jgi:hypothetical protein
VTYLITEERGRWVTKFGAFDYPIPAAASSVDAVSGVTVAGGWHAETHFFGVVGADFEYSADITWPLLDPVFGNSTDAHLQFRISDEGRYGVGVRPALGPDGVLGCELRLYRFLLPDRKCSDDPDVFAHCPLWIDDDLPEFQDIDSVWATFDSVAASGSTINIRIVAQGSRLTVHAGGKAIPAPNETDLGIGQFGLYVFSRFQDRLGVSFRNISATADTSARSNFALLYSTAGYDLHLPKRAILRTLNNVTGLDHITATFDILDKRGRSIYVKPPVPLVPVATNSQRTLGFQAWIADFTSVQTPGTYTLTVFVHTEHGNFAIKSDVFTVEEALLSKRVIKPMSIRNAQARRAADDDFRRNWQIESGRDAWSVGVDGAFIASAADDGAGATLRRVFNIRNYPLAQYPSAKYPFAPRDFRYVARITIIDGCDAQLQFRITDTDRWGVTLQAGSAGGCRQSPGLGAVRLHRETSDGGWYPLAARSFGPDGFQVGRPYDVEVRARGSEITVLIDGETMIEYISLLPAEPGQFGLKAWASTVRFERVQAWVRDVPLSYREPGIWIPYKKQQVPAGPLFNPPTVGLSAQGVHIHVPDTDTSLPSVTPNESLLDDPVVSYPIFSQYRGFHDCNNFIGEVTSHGVFLAGLMDVWSKRASDFDAGEREALRDAIVAAVLYLFGLYEQGNCHSDRDGRFAHQETGRAIVGPEDGIVSTKFAVYGLASFAAFGATVDRPLARQAMDLVQAGLQWLADVPDIPNLAYPDQTGDDLKSIAYAWLAVAAEREGLTQAPQFWDTAKRAAISLICDLAFHGIARQQRECLRSIPWFEGVYHVWASGKLSLSDQVTCGDQQVGFGDLMTNIADQLHQVLIDSANAFQIVPESTDGHKDSDDHIAWHNWTEIDELPWAYRPIPDTPPDARVGDWYVCEHYATTAFDCVCVGRIAGNTELQRLASGNLNWILGINPGLPASKVVPANREGSGGYVDGLPWRSASFIYNGPGAFVRTIEGNRTNIASSKGWRATWEESASSRHRETWWIDPLDNGFQTIVNGHVLDGEWYYWSVGPAGWISGETFMLIDGTFLKGALALEDWASPVRMRRSNPYDTLAFTFLDTTHIDRVGTDWPFDDPDRTNYAFASRAIHQIAAAKGYCGAKLTGHRLGERVGAIAVPANADVIWVPTDEITSTPWPFNDIDTASWAQVARAATELAIIRRGYQGGFFTGNVRETVGPSTQTYELICLNEASARTFDATEAEIEDTGWGFSDINSVNWAHAARAATETAISRGYVGGFFTGHQVANLRGVVGLTSD